MKEVNGKKETAKSAQIPEKKSPVFAHKMTEEIREQAHCKL
jgi:hypothetical protein